MAGTVGRFNERGTLTSRNTPKSRPKQRIDDEICLRDHALVLLGVPDMHRHAGFRGRGQCPGCLAGKLLLLRRE